MKTIMSVAGRIVAVLLALCLPLSAACSVGDNQVTPAPGIEEKINFCEIISEITGLEITSYDDEDMPSGVVIGYDGSFCCLDTNPQDVSLGIIIDREYYFYAFAIRLQVTTYIEEMNKALGLPAWLYEHMLRTNSLQGVQTEEYDNVTVRYTYHPDKGLEVAYYLK